MSQCSFVFVCSVYNLFLFSYLVSWDLKVCEWEKRVYNQQHSLHVHLAIHFALVNISCLSLLSRRKASEQTNKKHTVAHATPNLGSLVWVLITLDGCFLAHCCHYYAIRCICGILIVVVAGLFFLSSFSFSLSLNCNRKWRNATPSDPIWFIHKMGKSECNSWFLFESILVRSPQASDTFGRCQRRMREICKENKNAINNVYQVELVIKWPSGWWYLVFMLRKACLTLDALNVTSHPDAVNETNSTN